MICPKCGHELNEGNMYCEICGEEIHIVPDFEPEIENSISDVLNNVADEIDPSRLDNNSEDEIEHIHFLTDTIDIGNDVFIIPKSLMIKVLVALIVFVLAVLSYISVSIYRNYSYNYQIKCGDNHVLKGNFEEAVDYFEKAYKLNKDTIEPLKKIALTYENYENSYKAEEMYRKIIEINGDLYSVEALINLLVNDGKYDEACEIILEYGDDNIVAKYQKYLANDPVFSLASGEYDDIQTVKIEADSNGKIFYTLDGSEPGSDCILYEGPILLRSGSYEINAILVNDYGVTSNVINSSYIINTDIPDNPIISLADGTYDVPQLIKVTAPINTNVYYTTDGTEPSSMSAIYTTPIALPLGQSEYKFVAINDSGNVSDIIECHYNLDVNTKISQQDAIDLVAHRQFEIGRVITIDGTVPGSDGKYLYSFSELRYVQNRTMYFISEYYQEGTIRMVTGNLFAVDVFDGSIYQAVAGSNNTYTLHSF